MAPKHQWKYLLNNKEHIEGQREDTRIMCLPCMLHIIWSLALNGSLSTFRNNPQAPLVVSQKLKNSTPITFSYLEGGILMMFWGYSWLDTQGSLPVVLGNQVISGIKSKFCVHPSPLNYLPEPYLFTFNTALWIENSASVPFYSSGK